MNDLDRFFFFYRRKCLIFSGRTDYPQPKSQVNLQNLGLVVGEKKEFNAEMKSIKVKRRKKLFIVSFGEIPCTVNSCLDDTSLLGTLLQTLAPECVHSN